MLLSLSLLSLVVALLVLLPAARGLLSPASPGTPAPKNPANAYAAATEAFVKSDPTYAFGLYNNLAPSPYLWQRGLAAYAVGSYAAAADQFRLDRSVNGGDGEELIWEFASRAKGEAEGRKLELAKSIFPAEGRSRDPRPVVASTGETGRREQSYRGGRQRPPTRERRLSERRLPRSLRLRACVKEG